jgi:NAD(P)-dependent dehydrogenase (short-subunit alcohol dehydrogenase family)
MRILVVGATGTIGSAIAAALEARGHEVLGAGTSRGAFQVDIADPGSIENLYAATGPVDAVVCAAGVAKSGTVQKLSDNDLRTSLDNKLAGQVNLVRRGLGVVTEGGSFTLTSGDLSQAPGPGTLAVSFTGAAVEMFARAAAIDIDGRYRVNVVSPVWVAESRAKAGLDPSPGIWAKDLAEYYVDLVEGDQTGQIVNAEAAKA